MIEMRKKISNQELLYPVSTMIEALVSKRLEEYAEIVVIGEAETLLTGSVIPNATGKRQMLRDFTILLLRNLF